MIIEPIKVRHLTRSVKIRRETFPVLLKPFHDCLRGHFLKLMKSAFETIFLRTVHILTNRSYLEKQIFQCPDTYPETRLACFLKMKHTIPEFSPY